MDSYFEEYIKNYPDFPKKGINFKDIMPIFAEPEVFSKSLEKMSNFDFCKDAEAIIAVDARGFLFGAGLSLKLSKPLITARKPGKLPGEVFTKSYDLEYGSNSLSIQRESLEKFSSFVIVDDLLATGGTVECVVNLLKSEGKKILGLNVVIELTELNGKNRFSFPVFSHIKY